MAYRIERICVGLGFFLRLRNLSNNQRQIDSPMEHRYHHIRSKKFLAANEKQRHRTHLAILLARQVSIYQPFEVP